MQGQVIVLVVSIDEEPSGLIKELSRLGVEVLFGALHDCEQLIEENEPDLVVLFGARGAMELASLIEGHEGQTPPRMVIAADRKELAKMIGLNRDVVVSLFATESGDRVLSQRIESLARRAARRRTASIPPPSVKATQLGLPDGGTLGKLQIKKSVPMDAPRPGGFNPALAPVEPLRSMPLVEPALGVTDKRIPPTENHLAIEAVKIPVTKPTAAQVESVEVADDELLSLRPSEFPDAEIELESIPAPAVVPNGATFPPTLPPEAKDEAVSSRVTASDMGLASATEDDAVTAIVNVPIVSVFDISGAEAALENLENLLAHASKPAVRTSSEVTSEALTIQHDELTSPSSGADPLASAVLVDARPADPSEQGISASRVEFEGEMPSIAPDQELDERSVRASDGSEPPDLERPFAAEGFTGDAQINDARLDGSPGSKKRSSRSKLWWLPAALIAGATGLGIYVNKTAPAVMVAHELTATQSRTSAPSVDEQPEQRAPDEPAPAISSADDTDSRGEATDVLDQAVVVEKAAAQPVGSAIQAETTAGSQAGITPAERPFVVLDTKRPSCETLLSGVTPQVGHDVVHQASLLWGEARKLIVAGKVAEAHRKMCGAVLLNPESAAVEGLAQLYLDMFSLDQAELWANKAEQLRPGQRDITVLLGDIYGMHGDVDKALGTWRAALKLGEQSQSQLRAMSRDYGVEAGRRLRSGDIVKAEIWFRRAAIMDPSNLAALMGLANTFMRSDRPNYALAFAYQALAVSELIPEMQVLVGEVALKAGNMTEARLRFLKALSIRSDFYPAKRGLSLIK